MATIPSIPASTAMVKLMAMRELNLVCKSRNLFLALMSLQSLQKFKHFTNEVRSLLKSIGPRAPSQPLGAHTLSLLAHTLPLLAHTLPLLTHTLPLMAHTLPLMAHTLPLLTHPLPLMAWRQLQYHIHTLYVCTVMVLYLHSAH